MKRYYRPSCKSDPALAEAALQIELCGLRGKARKMLDYLDGTYALYFIHDHGFFLTDEALDLDEPRWTGPSLETLVEWLEFQWDAISEESEEFPC